MKTTPILAARGAWCLVVIAAWLCSGIALHAQGNGTIAGRVFNPANGEYVRNAEVRLQGTARLVAT
jgi:hypothetical protein